MRSALHFFIAILALSATGCDQMMDKTSEVTIHDQYKLTVPGSLAHLDNLNENASLEYGNKLQEFYVIVIDELKQEWVNALAQYGELQDSTITPDLKGYRTFLMDGFKQSVTNANFKQSKEFTVNNMPAHLYEIEGQVGGIEAYYYYTFVEGREHFYQILTWTLLDRRDKYRDEMETMTNTFVEL